MGLNFRNLGISVRAHRRQTDQCTGLRHPLPGDHEDDALRHGSICLANHYLCSRGSHRRL